VFLGRKLGGRPEERSWCVEGKVQYRKVAETMLFQEGSGRVVIGIALAPIALLCAEAEPPKVEFSTLFLDVPRSVRKFAVIFSARNVRIHWHRSTSESRGRYDTVEWEKLGANA
jgi:hypothetical protein